MNYVSEICKGSKDIRVKKDEIVILQYAKAQNYCTKV